MMVSAGMSAHWPVNRVTGWFDFVILVILSLNLKLHELLHEVLLLLYNYEWVDLSDVCEGVTFPFR